MFELELVRDIDSRLSFLLVNMLPGPKVGGDGLLLILPKLLKSTLAGRAAFPATAHPSGLAGGWSLRSPPRREPPRDILICRCEYSFS